MQPVNFCGLAEAADAIRERGRVVLVEGSVDVDRLHALGFKNVAAPLDPMKLDAETACELAQFTREVVVLYDGDRAGMNAAKVVDAACKKAGIAATISLLPSGSHPELFVRSAEMEELDRIFGVPGAVSS